MRSVPVRALIFGVALVAGCKPEPFRPDAGPLPPEFWQPKPGEADDWDIQLARTPFDISTPRAVYAIDLWDAVPAPTTLSYEGVELTVPAGAHASAIATLHGQTPSTIVICHVGTGSIRLTDPDAMKFPGYRASPPNRMDPPEPGSVIGWSTTSMDANERYIDIHAAARKMVAPLIEKRLELAKMIGCDAVAASNNALLGVEGSGIGHGFSDVPPEDYASWSKRLADHAHGLGLSIGPRDKSDLAGDMAGMYDWIMVDRCAEFTQKDCVPGREFLNMSKAVLAIEYDKDEDGMDNDTTTLCSDLQGAGIRSGIIKTVALDSTRVKDCRQ